MTPLTILLAAVCTNLGGIDPEKPHRATSTSLVKWKSNLTRGFFQISSVYDLEEIEGGKPG